MPAEKGAPEARHWSSGGWAKSLLLLALCDVVLNVAYFLIPDEWLRDVVHWNSLTRPCAALVGSLDATMTVMAQTGGVVGHGNATSVDMQIVRGCDGAGALFLLMSTIVALRGNVRLMVLGVALACLWSYLLNLTRIVGLYFVLAYKPQLFNTLHNLVIPLVIVLLSGIFATGWAHIMDNSRAAKLQGA